MTFKDRGMEVSTDGALKKNVLWRQWTASENINNIIKSSFPSSDYSISNFTPTHIQFIYFPINLPQLDIHLHEET